MTGLIVGIDPGAKGALAFLGAESSWPYGIEDMPTATGAALGAAITDLIADWEPHTIDAAWVEQVASRPGQGVASTFKFGVNYGAILGALGALRIPVHHVTPGVWKRNQRVTKDKGSSRQRAAELWPVQSSTFARVKDDGRAEAALIARYGAMQMRAGAA